MTMTRDNLIEASDVNALSSNFKNLLTQYEIRRQALVVDSVWNDATPDPVPVRRGDAPTPVVYSGSFSYAPPIAQPDNIISANLINNLTNAVKAFDQRLQQRVTAGGESIIKPGEVLNDYKNTLITPESLNVLFTILTRAYNILAKKDYYTNYVLQGGTCKRTCQVTCQSQCQLSCQGYHSCHNQKCGAH